MSSIKLLNTQNFAKLKGISRGTVWRRVKNGALDCYLLPGSSKKYFVAELPNIRRAEEQFLEELLKVETL